MSDIVFAPLVSPAVLTTLCFGTFLLIALTLWRSPIAGAVRSIALLGLLALIANPSLRFEDRQSEPDIVVLVSDESGSNRLDNRDNITTQAITQLKQQLSTMANIDVRNFRVTGEEETRLGDALSLALSDVPRAQLSGVLIVSDGRSADEIPTQSDIGVEAPMHVLLTGRDDEKDRRMVVVSAPRFGIVRETANVILKVEDENIAGAPAFVTLRLNGKEIATQSVPIGEDLTLAVPLEVPGKAIIDVEVSSVSGELTTRNNRVLIPISVIRDRLRVLLVSGEPHAGERVWRNLLKSDPAVDLVHFTILKPYEKEQPVPNNELALIPFPEDDLFLRKLKDFDVLIFDRYTYRNVLGPIHFDAISTYVRNGGAMLIAAGPELNKSGSLAQQRNLAFILPALPRGQSREQPFLPEMTQAGARHPVTSVLSSYGSWGRWLRLVPSVVSSGDVLMQGGAEPLLVVSRYEKGRVGMLLSDHVWLWARGFDGGGPHREFLRRLVHWLMKEPQLEEEALLMTGSSLGDNGTLTIERRTMADTAPPVRLIKPDGSEEMVDLTPREAGQWGVSVPVTQTGFYEAYTAGPGTDPLYAVAAIGLEAPPEYAAVTQSTQALTPLVEASGGGFYTVRNGENVTLPSLRKVTSGGRMTGRSGDKGWLGLADRKASALNRVTLKPVMPAALWALIIGLLLAGSWYLEGRKR